MIFLTVIKQLKILPTSEQAALIYSTMKEYIRCVNAILGEMIDYDQHYCLSSKIISANLPSCLKNQCARDANSIDKKMFKSNGRMPVLKKLTANWNNQNYTISSNAISFPVWKDGKSCRISVKAVIPADDFERLQKSSLGNLRITPKGKKLIAQIACERDVQESTGTGVMGVDLGLKCPAVCYTDSGKVKFIGNGRQNKYIRRKHDAKRKKLGKSKKQKVIKKIGNKEQRIMQDIDHKVSREIVNFAISNNIKTIKLEKLSCIHGTTRKSRKNEHNLHNWSFYRLSQYIEYKARLSGIEVVYVNPAYTSQKCPVCGKINHSNDRNYTCKCGYHGHRDLVGARNILVA